MGNAFFLSRVEEFSYRHLNNTFALKDKLAYPGNPEKN